MLLEHYKNPYHKENHTDTDRNTITNHRRRLAVQFVRHSKHATWSPTTNYRLQILDGGKQIALAGMSNKPYPRPATDVWCVDRAEGCPILMTCIDSYSLPNVFTTRHESCISRLVTSREYIRQAVRLVRFDTSHGFWTFLSDLRLLLPQPARCWCYFVVDSGEILWRRERLFRAPSSFCRTDGRLLLSRQQAESCRVAPPPLGSGGRPAGLYRPSACAPSALTCTLGCPAWLRCGWNTPVRISRFVAGPQFLPEQGLTGIRLTVLKRKVDRAPSTWYERNM